MTKFICSACGNQVDLTMVDGTVICMPCLHEIKKKAEENLVKAMGQFVKENDIYD